MYYFYELLFIHLCLAFNLFIPSLLLFFQNNNPLETSLYSKIGVHSYFFRSTNFHTRCKLNSLVSFLPSIFFNGFDTHCTRRFCNTSVNSMLQIKFCILAHDTHDVSNTMTKASNIPHPYFSQFLFVFFKKFRQKQSIVRRLLICFPAAQTHRITTQKLY